MEAHEEFMVKIPVVSAFTNKPSCPACGSGDGYGLRPSGRFWWVGVRFMMVRITYCAGNKEPTETRQSQGPIVVMTPTGPEVPEEEVHNVCAGIDYPHLHVVCKVCGCAWLMATKKTITRL